MPDTRFGLLPTMIGSMPHTDPAAAAAVISRFLPDIPGWCQLPQRSFYENMYVQFSEGMPGAVIKEEEKKIYIDRARDNEREVATLYTAYLENNAGGFPLSSNYAAGFYQLPKLKPAPIAVKGQVTGPVSFGLTVTDEHGTPLIYDDTYADLAAKLLRLKAAWQEQELLKHFKSTIIFIDEPYLVSLGSAFVAISKEKVLTLLGEVLGGVKGLKGIHCCGNTDWSLLLETSTNILSFDAYNYAEPFSLYPVEVGRFLATGGAIAWGIVPNSEELLAKESASSLKERLEEAMAPFTRKGLRFSELVEHGLITPSCGLASLSEEASVAALDMLSTLSKRMRQAYLKA